MSQDTYSQITVEKIHDVVTNCLRDYDDFISNQNLFDFWCEANYLCHELDESFPDNYDDHEAMKSFWKQHPYYFIDRLPINLVAQLLSKHFNYIDTLN